MLTNFLKKQRSSTEIHDSILARAKKYKVDHQSTTTSMGGMKTDHYELHKRVREEETFRFAKFAAYGTGLSIVISIINCISQWLKP
jgi:hypothetical protein